jgi:translation elongation factor EF-1beta
MVTELENNLSQKQLEDMIKKYSLVEKVIAFGINGNEFKFELEDVKYNNGKLILIYKEKI